MSQIGLDLPLSFPERAYQYGHRTDGETHGVVLTKPHIVDLILDVAGYTTDRDLGKLRLLEPSCGHGAFLVEAVRRLIRSAASHGQDPRSLTHAITAYDIDQAHVDTSRFEVSRVLVDSGFDHATAYALAGSWISHGDFLLTPHSEHFDVVVGNPPYIRIEHIDPALQVEYRARYVSLFDRADLYVAFIERGLRLLTADGVLSYICADRWVLNRYGAPLRKLVTQNYTVRFYIDLHRASPFASEVIAYPAIFAISRGTGGAVSVARMASASIGECDQVRRALRDNAKTKPNTIVSVYRTWFREDEPWIISTPEALELLRELEARFDPIETFPGTKVGIGVATGNDQVYIVGNDVDIESDRLVPLVMRSDIKQGRIQDSGRFVINTFREDGGPIDLRRFPRLAQYFEKNRNLIQKRHVSKKNPKAWFRTIDRVYPELVAKPKLLDRKSVV